jgi:hypothetical protein
MPDPNADYQEILPLGSDDSPFRLLTTEHVKTSEVLGKRVVQVEPAALTLLAREAMREIAHYLRPGHLQQLRNILDDFEASPNDRFVALDLLKNANIGRRRRRRARTAWCTRLRHGPGRTAGRHRAPRPPRRSRAARSPGAGEAGCLSLPCCTSDSFVRDTFEFATECRFGILIVTQVRPSRSLSASRRRGPGDSAA